MLKIKWSKEKIKKNINKVMSDAPIIYSLSTVFFILDIIKSIYLMKFLMCTFLGIEVICLFLNLIIEILEFKIPYKQE